MRIKSLISAALAATLVACSSSNDVTDANDTNYGKVAAQVIAGVGSRTRMSDTSWEAGDSIGVFAIGSNQTTMTMVDLYTNAKYTLSQGSNSGNGTFTADKDNAIYYENNGEIVTFAAYYPYRADAKYFTIDTRDNSAEGQRQIDILYATGAYGSTESPALYFTGDKEFRHVMSKLSFNIKCSTDDGFATSALPDDAKVYISGLVHDGAIDIYGDAVPRIQDGVKSEYRWDVTDTYRSLILIPQNLTTTPITIEVIVGGQTYRNNTSITPNMESGTVYTYTITLRKKALEVSGSTIAPWKDGNGGSGDAVL
jgi:hypothetical protein